MNKVPLTKSYRLLEYDTTTKYVPRDKGVKLMEKHDRKFRIEQLKQKIKIEEHTNALFDECIDGLGANTRIYSLDESVRVVAMLVMSFSFTN